MKQNLISVIIPVYNLRDTLDNCLISLVLQTYSNIEVLLIDDGSTDGSDKICDSWKKKDHRIISIHKSNGGVSSSRNIGLQKSRGDFVIFIDGDDELSPDMLEKMIDEILYHHADLCYCGYRFLSDTKNKLFIPDKHLIETSDRLLNSIFENKSFYSVVWNKLFSRNVLKDANGEYIKFDETVHVGEDQLWLVNILKKVNLAVPVSEPLYIWNRRLDSATNGSIGVSLTK